MKTISSLVLLLLGGPLGALVFLILMLELITGHCSWSKLIHTWLAP